LTYGLGAADAVHVAFAEEAEAEFVTVDDRLLRQCHRMSPDICFFTKSILGVLSRTRCVRSSLAWMVTFGIQELMRVPLSRSNLKA
jgi:hypothetical protein